MVGDELRVVEVRKSFPLPGGGSLPVLADVSFSVPAGGFCGILGPSGCGKTTLLRLIAGLETPDSGSVSPPPNAAPRPMVTQGGDLYPWMSVEENVLFGLPAGVRGRERCALAMAEVGLEGFERFLPGQLSGGMQRRVSLARALACAAPLVLLDEPLAFLDGPRRRRMQVLLARVHSAGGSTFVLVTHDAEEAAQLCGRVIVLSARPGRVLAVLDAPRAEELYRLVEEESTRAEEQERLEILAAGGRR